MFIDENNQIRMKYSSRILSILFGIGIVYFAWQRLANQAMPTSTIAAVVTDIKALPTQDAISLTRVAVSFQPTRHETYRAAFNTEKVFPFEIGDTIEVYFSPKDMQRIEWKMEE